MEVCAALTVEDFERPNLGMQCALLHDVIEDTDTTYEQVAQRFGDDVARGVMALTKDEGLPKPEAMADSLQRIRDCSPEVWAVKLADRITNLQKPPAKWSPEKRTYYVNEADIILAQLGDASAYLRERLRLKIVEYRSQHCGSD